MLDELVADGPKNYWKQSPDASMISNEQSAFSWQLLMYVDFLDLAFQQASKWYLVDLG